MHPLLYKGLLYGGRTALEFLLDGLFPGRSCISYQRHRTL